MSDLLNEARNLEQAANGGDAQAAFKLAWFYYNTGKREIIKQDPDKAAFWLDRASDLGHTEAPKQLLTLLSQDNYPNAGGDTFITWLVKLANDKIPMYMVELAAIRCAEPGNPFITKFRYDECKGFINPSEGYQLFEEAIELAEKSGDAMLHSFYYRAYDAYRIAKKRLREIAQSDDYKPDDEQMKNLKENHIYLMKQGVRYAKKAAATAEGNGTQEYVDTCAKIADDAVKELEAVMRLG